MAGNLKNKLEVKQGGLSVVKAPKTKPYNDIDLNNWKLYSHIKTGSLWEFSSRDKSNGHSYDYHGNYIPQIATQLFERFTKKNDVILDLFFGSGTSGIEALNMERRCIGVELKEEMVDYVSKKFTKRELVSKMNIICADSASLNAKEKIEARLEIMGKKKRRSSLFCTLHTTILLNSATKKKIYQIVPQQRNFTNFLKKSQKTAMTCLKKNVLQPL